MFQDPKRTRYTKTRKLLAKKKRRAFINRRKKHEQKERMKFKPAMSSTTSKATTLPHERIDISSMQSKHLIKSHEGQDKVQTRNHNDSVPLSTGLRGGAPNLKAGQEKSDQLQLRNRGTDCFMNSIIQLLRNTGYITFIKEHLQPLLVDAPAESYKLSRSLLRIYSSDSKEGGISAAHIRSLVAEHSGKSYLDANTQQDAEEFFRALETMLSEELVGSDEFGVFRSQHWGRETLSRRFLDNTAIGSCHRCGKSPTTEDNPFLVLKLKNLPRANIGVALSSLIQAHFSESTETIFMRCSYCCEQQDHQNNNKPCPQTGICKDRGTVEMCQLTKAPEFLLIQLIRNIGNQPKVMTYVKIVQGLLLLSSHTYELVATLDHIGDTPRNGHYVTFLKIDSGNWIKFDDERSMACSLKQANTRNNYILLFKRKVILNKPQVSVIVSQASCSVQQDDLRDQIDLDTKIKKLEAKLMKSIEEKDCLKWREL